MGYLKSVFNLIAKLISLALGKKIDFPDSPSQTEANNINSFVERLLAKYINIDEDTLTERFDLSSAAADEIYNAVKDKSFYYIRVLLTRLDNLLDRDQIYTSVKYDSLINFGAEKYKFTSLNDNFKETGIYVLPVIPTVKTSRRIGNRNLVRRALISPGLKGELKNIYYVEIVALKGFKITNLVYDCKLKDDKFLTVVATPLFDCDANKLIALTEYEDKEGEIVANYFSLDKVDAQSVNRAFEKVLLSCAEEKDVDIIMGPEFVGTKEFNETDELGFNKNIRQLENEAASIIIPPTYYSNRKNVLSVYSRTGEKLGEQHKQVPFIKNGYNEDLRNREKRIFILYVKGIGKICFPVCKDFLFEDYAEIIIKELKPDLILCPSFSQSASSFNGVVGNATSHDCKVIWINCCAGFANKNQNDAFVGFSAGNYIPADKSVTYCQCKNSGQCAGCYFKIKIPLNAASERFYTDKATEIKQKLV